MKQNFTCDKNKHNEILLIILFRKTSEILQN
jgi:hypothetical protein